MWVSWVWKNPLRRVRADGQCRWCDRVLTVCPACRGQWREDGCRACGLGVVCPEHGAFWLV